jgi:predicted nucleic acid-binding protein
VRSAERPVEGGVASVQVLNEFANVARKKLRVGWPEIELALAQFRSALDAVAPISLNTHTIGMELARDHKLPVYDALIVAAAIEAGCDTIYSEDLQAGRGFGKLAVVNTSAGNRWTLSLSTAYQCQPRSNLLGGAPK